MRASQVGGENLPGAQAVLRLEDVIAIAVVIAAGCEPCAASMVERALSLGAPPQLVMRTLGIVARVRSTACFVQAVGPEAVVRMGAPLEAARKTLAASDVTTNEPRCCG